MAAGRGLEAAAVIVEGLLASCIGYLILGPGQGRLRTLGPVSLLTDGQRAPWMLDRTHALAEQVDEAIRAWVAQARIAIQERNALVHSMWMLQLSDGAAVGFRSRAKGPAVRIAGVPEFTVARDLMEAAQVEGRRIVARLSSGPS